MIKVKIIFYDRSVEEFYADGTYMYENGMIYWYQADTGDTISYNPDNIFKIVEREIRK